jgi:hypothetical protein
MRMVCIYDQCNSCYEIDIMYLDDAGYLIGGLSFPYVATSCSLKCITETFGPSRRPSRCACISSIYR